MPEPIYETLVCERCGHSWKVNLTKLGKPRAVVYRGGKSKPQDKTRVETFRLSCPICGTVTMLDVTFEEASNG